MNEQEIEVKFHISKPDGLIEKLKACGALQIQTRILEINLRFDTADMSLSHAARVLRLRQDEAVRLTYKGPGQVIDGVLSRQEIEFTVSDFQAARHFLEALGYQVIVAYEKYRQTYRMGDLDVTVDEMPYGCFAEIEGPYAIKIQAAADLLQLDWSKRIIGSYLDLFSQLKVRKGYTFKDLTFENFKEQIITPSDLRVSPAD